MIGEMTGEATGETTEGGVNRGVDVMTEAGPTSDAVIKAGNSASPGQRILQTRAGTRLLDIM